MRNAPWSGFFKSLSFAGMLCLLGAGLVFPADETVRDAPLGAAADVIQAKIQQEAENTLLQPAAPREVTIEEEKAPESKLTGPTFYVQKFIVEGDLVLPPEEYEPLLTTFENQTISFEQLQKLIAAVEQVFRAKGYIAIVLLPPQKMEKPEIRLKVLVSKVGEVSVINNRFYASWRTKSYWKIKRGNVLNYNRIRASVLDMNENPDRTVKPILRAGKEKGTSDIVLNVEDRFPIHGGYSFDNQGVKLTGKDRNGFTIRNNNMLGLDDIFLIGTTFGKKDFGVIYLYHLLPVSNFGTKLISSFSHAQVNPKKQYTIYGINSVANTYSVALQQRVVRTDKYSGTVQVGFDFKDKHTLTQSVTTVWDQERVLSFRADFQSRDKWGGWGLGQGFYIGMPVRGNGWPLASRDGNHEFFKYSYSLTRVQKLFFGARAIWDLQGQISPNRLLPVEQMFLGGAKSVRGYPESDYGADQAIQSRLDLLVPAFFIPKEWKLPFDKTPLRNQVDMIYFLDAAYGSVHNPSETEKLRNCMIGTGGGFQVRYRDNLSIRLEWGVPLANEPLTERGNSQLHITFAANY